MWGKFLKNLFKYLKYYTVESILGPLFKLLEAMFELFRLSSQILLTTE